MKEAGIRGQGSGVSMAKRSADWDRREDEVNRIIDRGIARKRSGLDTLGVLGVCCVKGCGGLATEETETGIYCWRCLDEITALQAMALIEKAKAKERGLIMHWIWVPEAIAVVGLLGFVGWKFIQCFADWICGGVQ